MLFSSLVFWLFFAAVFFAYWRVTSEDRRIWLLLIASYIFYGLWDWRFLALIGYVTFVAYYGGYKTFLASSKIVQRRWMLLSVVSHLTVLCIFKYLNFFTQSIEQMLSMAGMQPSFTALNIILPVGVSFYVFQAISYNVDIYRRDVKGSKSLRDVAFYIAFFPQLVAGPIVRAAGFFAQIPLRKTLDTHVIYSSVRIILIGLIYKVLLADNISPYVDQIYGDLDKINSAEKIAATIGFYAQIYFDFAGYTFIAIGLARLLGYRIPKNFNYPYLASSVTDFWRRWHISLSTWLRDYLYIPLGGNRCGRLAMFRNLFLTMALGGLWHGANVNFIIWGSIHGAALIVHKLYAENLRGLFSRGIAYRFAGFLLTQYIVLLAWVFFRAQTFDDAMSVLAAFFDTEILNGAASPALLMAAAFMIPLFADHLMGFYKKELTDLRPSISSTVILAVVAGVLFGIALMMVPLETQPFIYFQF